MASASHWHFFALLGKSIHFPLFQYFSGAAHNPLTNQPQQRFPSDSREAASRFLQQVIREPQRPLGLQVDALSWHSLQHPYAARQQQRHSYGLDGEPLYSTPLEVYAEPRVIHESIRRPRAQPQAPRKMGRRWGILQIIFTIIAEITELKKNKIQFETLGYVMYSLYHLS